MKAQMFKATEISIKKFWLKKAMQGIELDTEFLDLLRKVDSENKTTYREVV